MLHQCQDHPPIVIINLENAATRKKHMEMELKKQGILNYTFFKAINGLEINYNDNPLFSKTAVNQLLNAPQRYGLTLSPGAAGLYATWNEIINLYENHEDIIIVEDDIVFSENFLQELKTARNNAPSDYDILYLGSHSRKNIIDNDNLLQPHDLIRLSQVQINGTFCMMISKNGRQKIKKICFPVNDLQIDTVLYMNFDKLEAYHINKSIAFFKENSFESTIQNNMNIFSLFKDLEIHILICNKDFNMGMESIDSLLKYDEFKYIPIYYHDDGTLTNEQKQILKFKNLNLIGLDTFNSIESLIKKYEFCNKYRCMNKPYSFWHKIKLFDYFLLSKTKRILGLDTDILFMNKPNDMLRLIRTRKSFYMPDCSSSYCFNGVANTHLDGVLYNVNTGIIYIDNENDYRIDLIEEGLKQIIINDANYFPSWIEQSAFAYMFSKLNTYSALDGNKYKFPYFQQFDVNSVEALHFVSYPPCRMLWKQHVDSLNLSHAVIKKHLIDTIHANVVITDTNLPHNDSGFLIERNVPILLQIYVFDTNVNYVKIDYKWNLPSNKKLSHIFKANEIEYHFGSEPEGSFFVAKTKKLSIYHTYEWYGHTNWKLIKTFQ
jgi:GR25 family glycosyltransferase involved in LPS biosynthesis